VVTVYFCAIQQSPYIDSPGCATDLWTEVFDMHTSGKMVFTMTLLAAATPFVLPRVLAPSPARNVHPALMDTAHPANLGNPHPADFGNPHPANFGDPHPALTAEVNPAFPKEVINEEENVRIDPSQLQGNVTFAFPHAAHVTIVLPDGVQFAVNDRRDEFDHRGVAQQSNSNSWPGFAPLVGPALQTNFALNPGSQVITNGRSGQGLQPLGSALITNRSDTSFNEPAGAQPHIRFRNGQKR
jgi:hypothetical protein